MFAGEGEAGVDEFGAWPARGAMAGLAGMREGGGLVVGIRSRVVGGQMAGGASARSACIDAAGVALSARGGGVFAGQRKAAVRVGSSSPGGRSVAGVARLGEAGGLVVRVRSAVVGGQMAGGAGLRRSLVHACGVAAGAFELGVPAGLHKGGMNDACAEELRCAVAELAWGRECLGAMIGRCPDVAWRHVAAGAGARRTYELAVFVTGEAVDSSVPAGKFEAIVTESRALPGLGCMARAADRRITGSLVAGMGGGLIRRKMTVDA